MSKRTEVAEEFISRVRAKQFGETAAVLAENVVLTVPGIGPIEGRGGVEAALRMASESGRGLERVGWPAPREEADGTVVLSGKAPPGLLGIVAKLLKKQVAVTITCAFADDDKIAKLDIVTA